MVDPVCHTFVVIGSSQKKKVYDNQILETKATSGFLFVWYRVLVSCTSTVFTPLILENVVQPTKYIQITLQCTMYLTNYDRNY